MLLLLFRSDELRAEVKAEQDEKALRVQRLHADLKRSQALLDTAERGVNNLHFRMSCVPVEVRTSRCSRHVRMVLFGASCSSRLLVSVTAL